MTIPRYKWQPNTAEIAAAAGIDPADVERFDHNTSPFPTPWAAEVATRSLRGLNEYPAADYRTLRRAAAEFTGLDETQIVPGAGADELILLSGRAFLGPGKTAVAPVPTYPLYEIATLQTGARFDPLPTAPPRFELPAATLRNAAAGADLTWICAPGNPIGDSPDRHSIESIVSSAAGIVVIDAAYAEFADPAGSAWSELVGRYDNLVVLRTLSKAFGIAAARVGYAMGRPDLIAAIDGVRPPGSISTLSVDLGIAALSDPERMRQTVAAIQEARAELGAGLTALGLRVYPSATNFLLCEVGADAHAVAAALMEEGLVVRKFPADGPLWDHLRFTVRTRRAHTRLLTSLERHLT
jgi:histidinol-phosphate aminotransferase